MIKTILASLVRIDVPPNLDTLFVCLTSALKSTPAAEVNARNMAIAWYEGDKGGCGERKFARCRISYTEEDLGYEVACPSCCEEGQHMDTKKEQSNVHSRNEQVKKTRNHNSKNEYLQRKKRFNVYARACYGVGSSTRCL